MPFYIPNIGDGPLKVMYGYKDSVDEAIERHEKELVEQENHVAYLKAKIAALRITLVEVEAHIYKSTQKEATTPESV